MRYRFERFLDAFPWVDAWRRAVPIAVAVAGWHVAVAQFALVDPTVVPPPGRVLRAGTTLVGRGYFHEHLVATLRRVVLAASLAGAVGLPVGLAMGYDGRVKAVLHPLFKLAYPLPKIALLPLFMLVLGAGDRAFVVTSASAAGFLVLYNAMVGAENISSRYAEVARDNGVDSTVAYVREVVLPGSLPMIATGVRLMLNTVLLVTISVEFIAADRGLGSFIWSSWRTLQMSDMYVAIVVLSAMGVGISVGVERAAARLMPWRAAVYEE